MARRTQDNDTDIDMHAAYACLLENGLDGAAEALRILVNQASLIEREQHLQAAPYERSSQRRDYANGFKSKTVLTRLGEIEFKVPRVRSGGFYPSALERGSRSEQAMNLALAEMYVQGVSTRKVITILQNSWGQRSTSHRPKSAAAPHSSMKACRPGAHARWGMCRT